MWGNIFSHLLSWEFGCDIPYDYNFSHHKNYKLLIVLSSIKCTLIWKTWRFFDILLRSTFIFPTIFKIFLERPHYNQVQNSIVQNNLKLNESPEAMSDPWHDTFSINPDKEKPIRFGSFFQDIVQKLKVSNEEKQHLTKDTNVFQHKKPEKKVIKWYDKKCNSTRVGDEIFFWFFWMKDCLKIILGWQHDTGFTPPKLWDLTTHTLPAKKHDIWLEGS